MDAINAYAMMAGRVSALSGVVPQVALVLGQWRRLGLLDRRE